MTAWHSDNYKDITLIPMLALARGCSIYLLDNALKSKWIFMPEDGSIHLLGSTLKSKWIVFRDYASLAQ